MGPFKHIKGEGTFSTAGPPPVEAATVTAQIVSVGTTSGMHDGSPIIPLRLLIVEDGQPPRPVSAPVIVPMSQLGRLQPGASIEVHARRPDSSAPVVLWFRPAGPN